MKLKQIKNAEVGGKRVLVRVDFNVSVDGGHVKEKFKIEACKETVEHLLGAGAKVALLSHLGRPFGRVDFDLSFEKILPDIELILERKVRFSPNCIEEEVVKSLDKLGNEEVLLLENVRFHEGEKTNNGDFAEALAANFDIYVNDAFSVCHRDQASVTGVAKILPSYAGLRILKELEHLDKVKHNPEHPATAIIGGAKIETKLPLIENFEKNYEHILVGGKVACEAIDNEMKFGEKVMIASDFAGDRFDIGPQSLEKFKEIVFKSKTIVWNGPMGKFEIPPFDRGTRELIQAVAESGAFSLIGGGESTQALTQSGLMDKISFVSTGGGAMLEYLGRGIMPGLRVLEEK